MKESKSPNKIIGILLVVAAIAGYYFGETSTAQKKDSFNVISDQVISISSTSIDPENEGKLVHISGKIDTQDILEDSEFGVFANALKIERTVEMYQWKENENGTEEDKTYEYEKVWSDDFINSDNFTNKWLHENPDGIPYEEKSKAAEQLILGKFKISTDFSHQISATEELIITDDSGLDIKKTIGWSQKYALVGNKIFIGSDSMDPNIGDIRISFHKASSDEYSIIGKQSGENIEKYSQGDLSVNILSKGTLSANEMIVNQIQKANQSQWVFRGIAAVAGVIGLAIVFSKPKLDSATA